MGTYGYAALEYIMIGNVILTNHIVYLSQAVNGVVAFRREKYMLYEGPSGGNGGRGDVYVQMDGEMNSLLPFCKSVHFCVSCDAHGMGQQQVGAKGEDVVVKVPPWLWRGHREGL